MAAAAAMTQAPAEPVRERARHPAARRHGQDDDRDGEAGRGRRRARARARCRAGWPGSSTCSRTSPTRPGRARCRGGSRLGDVRRPGQDAQRDLAPQEPQGATRRRARSRQPVRSGCGRSESSAWPAMNASRSARVATSSDATPADAQRAWSTAEASGRTTRMRRRTSPGSSASGSGGGPGSASAASSSSSWRPQRICSPRTPSASLGVAGRRRASSTSVASFTSHAAGRSRRRASRSRHAAAAGARPGPRRGPCRARRPCAMPCRDPARRGRRGRSGRRVFGDPGLAALRSQPFASASAAARR